MGRIACEKGEHTDGELRNKSLSAGVCDSHSIMPLQDAIDTGAQVSVARKERGKPSTVGGLYVSNHAHRLWTYPEKLSRRATR